MNSIEQWLPEKPEEQLQLALNIILSSFSAKAKALEDDLEQSGKLLAQKNAHIEELEDRVAELEHVLKEERTKSTRLAEEN